MHDYDEHSVPPDSSEPRRRRRIPASVPMRSLLSLVTIACVAAAGVATTNATFTDQVTMASINVTGGSLDMVANTDTGDAGVAWSADLDVDLTGLVPGDEKSGTVEIANTGDLPYTLTTTTSGTDSDSCYSYFFRETAVTGGSGSAAQPVLFTGMGTAAGADGTTAAFATAITDMALPDNGADVNWEAGDAKQYTMTVRMDSSCTKNGAAGSLDVSFDATQV